MGKCIISTFFASPKYFKGFSPIQLVLTCGLCGPTPINIQVIMVWAREGNGTPLQYSCLENPVDRGAWQAAVHGVAEGRTRLTDFYFHFLLSCFGEGNGNPLQCSCLENPRDGGAWWALVSGVAQSRTRLKRLSSSSSSMVCALVYGLQTQSFLPLNYLSYFPLILFPSFIFY